MAQALPNFLASLGKTELKPGGVYATTTLVHKLGIKTGEHALLIGTAAANTALYVSMTTRATTEALVADEHEKVTESDPALRKRSTARIGKPSQLPFPDAHFDAAMLESALCTLPAEQAAACLREVARTLKPGGRIGLHELCWRQPPTPEREQALHQVWQGFVRPQVVRGWWDELEAAGFTGIESDTAAMTWFSRKGLENDEGHETTVNIFHSALEDDARLARYTAAYREFVQNRRYYGVILATARKSETAA